MYWGNVVEGPTGPGQFPSTAMFRIKKNFFLNAPRLEMFNV
jgi:hypothetical protein